MKNKVIELAIKMCDKSLAPFSNYKVGSSVETISGEICANDSLKKPIKIGGIADIYSLER